MNSKKKSESRFRLPVLLLFILVFLIIAIFPADALITMISEVVSTSSAKDSRMPSVAVSPVNPYLIHFIWEDDTELNTTSGSVPIRNGPDKDIFYIYKNRTEFSRLHTEGGQMAGGVEVVSNNESIISSQNPRIVADYKNITHVVWQGLIKPPELEADSNTTFLAHFDDPTFNANYALGQQEPLLMQANYSSNSIYNQSVYIKDIDKLIYGGPSNINMTRGTIEFWYNPQYYARNDGINVLFYVFNETRTNIVNSSYFYIALLNSYKTGILVYYNNNISNYIMGMNFSPSYESKKNEWHHVAFTYNLVIGDCRLYYDGFLAAVNTSCQGTGFIPANFSIGSLSTGDTTDTSLYRAEGMIDELRISKNTRSADEIRNDAGQFDIFHRSLNGSAWSGITTVTSDDSNNSYFPRFDVDRNNTLNLVWNSYHNDTFSIVKFKRRGWTNPLWSSAEVASSSAINYFPDIAVDENNNSHVAWQEIDTSSGNFSWFSTIVYSMRNQTSWAAIENVSNRTYEIYGVNATRGKTQFIFSMPSVASGGVNTTHFVWATQSPAPDQDMLFYLSFDDMSANVTFANKTTLSHQNSTYPFFPGRKDDSTLINNGHALYVNATGFANYSAANNFNYQYGTIMMWVKPDWTIGSKESNAINVLLGYYSANASATDINEFMVLYINQCDGTTNTCEDTGSSLLTFFIYDNASSSKKAIINASGWDSNAWRHIAITWNLTGGNRETKLYLNGTLMDYIINPNDTNKIYFNDTPTEIIIGNLFVESTNKYPYAFNGSIDEVMVFGRILGENEIKAAYKKDIDIVYRQKNDSGWQAAEFVSSGSNDISAAPSIAAKDNYAYVSWAFAKSNFEYYTKNYSYGAFYKIAMNTRNISYWKGVAIVNDESTKEAYSPHIISGRTGKVDVVWEDTTKLGIGDTHVLYREYGNTTSPDVELTYPVGGEIISETEDVEASASDVDSTVSNVSFYYTTDDGFSGNLICTDTSPEENAFSCSWIVGATAEDFYRVKAIATSDDGGKNWSMSNYLYIDSSTATKLYTFSEIGNDIGENVIYEYARKVVSETPQPNVSVPSTLGNDVTETARENVSSADNARYKTSINTGCGDHNDTQWQIFKFYINESVSNISNIKVQWRGYGYNIGGYITYLGVWNYSSSWWDYLDSHDFVEQEDDDLIGNIKSGISNYLDAENNTLYVYVYTDDYRSSSCGGGSWNQGVRSVCPFYLSWNGTDYRFETEGILGIFSRHNEMPTYDRLYHPDDSQGKVKVAIAEMMDESTHMDSAELISVDHNRDVDVMIDPEGNMRTIKNPQKVSCKDRMGKDCTQLVQLADERPEGALSSMNNGLVSSRSLYDAPLKNGPEGSYWVSNLSAVDPSVEDGRRDYIEITLPEPADEKDSQTAKLIVGGSDTGLLGISESRLFGLAGETVPHLFNILDNTEIGSLGGEGIFKTATIKIQVENEEGEWEDYPARFDNALMGSYRTLLFPLDRTLLKGSRIRLNMLSYAYLIDYVAVDYSKDEDVIVSRIKPDVQSLAESDDVRETLRTGDFIELSFMVPEISYGEDGGMQRSYFLKTEGYYHPGEREDRSSLGIEEIKRPIDIIAESIKVENWTLYARMIYNPSYAEEYMLESYLRTNFSGIGTSGIMNANPKNKTHNSLYTNFLRVTVSGCVVPYDNMEVWDSTTFCANGYYTIPDADNDGAVIKIMGSNLTLDCAGSILDSGGSSDPYQNQNRGVGMGMNHTYNVTIKNCTVKRYYVGMGMNYSTDAQMKNNTMIENYIGIGGEASNNSMIVSNTVIRSYFVGTSIIGGSTNNTIANNTAINITLLGFALDNADNNTIEFNTINGTMSRMGGKDWSGIGGIALMKNADRNTIRNNTMYDLGLGIGMADAGFFLGQQSYGYAGQKNNFTSNIMNRIYAAGIGLMYPYDEDYYNYFDQNNVVNGERIYYYYDVHGNATDYVQISSMNLTGDNVSLFAGKLTLVNCSYINVTNSNFSNNFFGFLAVASNDILLSNNRAYKNRDISLLSVAGIYPPTGAAYAVINSNGINFTDNNATSNRIGYYTKDSYNITFINNTAWLNSAAGFFINNTNLSALRNNTAFFNYLVGYKIQHSSQNKVINNTARDGNDSIGFYFGGNFNTTITGNVAYNNTHSFMLNWSNDTFSNNTAINNSIAGVTFAQCLNNSIINVSDNTVESNSGAGYMFFICNNTRAVNLNTTGNLRAGFEIYGSSYLSLSNLWPREDDIGFLFNQSQNCTLANSYSVNATGTGIYFYSSKDNYMVDSFLINNVSGSDIYSETDSWNNNFLNCSLGISEIGDDGLNSNISIQWYLDMYIQDNESVPVDEASVWLNDTLENTYSVIGDSYAKARANLTEYVLMGGVATYFSNYTWNVTKVGYMSNVSMVNMSQNRDVNVTINLLGGVADTSPPTAPVVYDGYDYVDYDWTNNASVLFGSWSNSTDRHLIFYGYRVLENGTCIAGKCAPTEVGQLTQVMITGITLREGYNYSLGVRARDSLYYYSSFVYSDGIIADLTPPNATINSTTHPNSSQWYSTQNVTFTFYGSDSLSGIAGYSYVLDENSGTGPDLIEEPAGETVLQSMPSHNYGTTLRANSTGHAFAVFSEIRSNLSAGDNVTISVALSEDVSDTLDTVVIKAYLIPTTVSITGYDAEVYTITGIEKAAIDLSHKNAIDADSYSFDLRVNPGASGYFYAVITADIADDNNTHNISVMGRNTNVDNTTLSFICEEGGSCTNTTLTADYAIEATKKEGSITRTKSYTGLANGEHWFHARARDVAGNWGAPEHFKVMIDAVNGTPILSTVKPVGYIATSEPTLVVDTNEYTTCYYNTTNLSYSEMTSYDGLHHEKKLSGLAEGTYVYSFNCTDRAGNTIYNDTTFIVDLDAAPDTVSIFAPGNYTVGKPVNIDVNVTRDSYGLGELAGYFAVNLTNSTSDTYKVSAQVTDKGNGIYTVSFTAPLTAGEYTLTISVMGITNTPERRISISTHTLTVRYSSTGMTAVNTKTRMAYGIAGSSYIIGVAGDAAGATSSGTSTSQLQIAGQAINDNLYLFITRSNSKPESVAGEIDGQDFMGMDNPSFGYPSEQEEHIVSAMLEYNDVSIEGVNKVQSGRYTLLIKNEGINQTTGKTRVSVSII